MGAHLKHCFRIKDTETEMIAVIIPNERCIEVAFCRIGRDERKPIIDSAVYPTRACHNTVGCHRFKHTGADFVQKSNIFSSSDKETVVSFALHCIFPASGVTLQHEMVRLHHLEQNMMNAPPIARSVRLLGY
jgi:hypothetical protein|eukprot:scaffold14544_cov248-Alexandrium_tamarense.AAC.1